jgi:HAD superfamily hydrolase (TIGR01509 family)
MAVEALIFDIDGTLVDSEPQHHQAWEQTLIAHGVASFSWEQFTAYIGTSNEKVAADFIESAALDLEVTELVRRKQQRYLHLIPQIALLPGVTELLNRFAGSCRLAVASSSHLLELERILAVHGLRQTFAVVLGGDMVARKKPYPDIYLEASRRLGVAPHRCAAFEDSAAGVLAAKRAGMTVIAVPNGSSQGHDFSPADLVIARIDQVDAGVLAGLIAPCAPASAPR